MGELARAELTSEHTDAPRGKTVATVAVQETLYALVIIAIAIPGSLVFSAGIAGIGVALMGTLGVLLVLTSNRAFRKVVWIMQRLPLAKRGVAWAKGLHEQTQHLLRDPKTWGWIILSIFGAVIELTLFWLLIRTLCGGDISWITTTFIYGAAYLAGAIANPVGGVGGFEATAIGLLHVLGVLAPAAVAVALLQRVADKGVITVVGVVVWFFLRAEIKRVQFRRKAAAGAADLLRPPDAALVLLGTANS
jgi:uncharacterized membrane protein YbhN (UPF0104 family)